MRGKATPLTVGNLLVQTVPEGDCLVWSGCRFANGYGAVGHQMKTLKAHRAMMIALGKPPGKLIVRHTCDNKPCINPKHLVLGTTADNYRDAIERKRRPSGSMMKRDPDTGRFARSRQDFDERG